MNKIQIPQGYAPVLDEYDTQRAIAYIKQTFQNEFAAALNLKREVGSFVCHRGQRPERQPKRLRTPVSFDVPAIGTDAQVVHSLAKWKRLALKKYNFSVGNGLYTDMNAILPRRGA